MDPSSYKDFTTARGVKYHYYFSAPQESQRTIVFVHGFPSTSWDWRHIVPFFKEQGYGIIAPDMLGYGGTDKPTDPNEYKFSLITSAIVEILDAEHIAKAVAIGHDWGSIVVSRLANYYPDRFYGFAWLAVPYSPPSPGSDAVVVNEYIKKLVGREVFGYWFFMAADGSDKLIEENWESFRSLLYPHDPQLWKDYICKTGGLQQWLSENRTGPLPSYLTEEESNHHRDLLLKGGFAGPLCWYRAAVSGVNSEDDKGAPLENYDIQHPVFYGGAINDNVSLMDMGKAIISQKCKGSKVFKEYDGDHWVILSHAKDLNEDLLAWVKSIQ